MYSPTPTSTLFPYTTLFRSKAKEDRLKLISATNTNISSIFGLFFDRKKQWKKWIAQVLKENPMCRGTEKKNLQHRSEEHTSELQSRRDLVCRLLLEKKKTNN